MPARNVIAGPDGEQHIEPKAMQVLLCLAAAAGEVVSRQQLLSQVWPDTYSGEEALTCCISLLRSTLGEDRPQRRFIETVPKTGYRLIAAVAEHTVVETSPDPEPPAKNSIAVLAFDDMSADKDHAYMSDGIAEELLHLLAKIPSLRVTARTSAFSFRDSNATIREIGAQLNVAYVMEGAVRTAGNRLRITAQLIEVSSEAHIWSETLTREIDDIFTVQDEIAAEVADKLKLSLAAEFPARQMIDGRAYTLFLQAMYLLKQDSLDSKTLAAALLRQVLEIEPGYAPALTALASSEGSVATPSYRRARALIDEALKNAPDYAPAIAMLGLVTLWEGDHVGAAPYIQRALKLAPAEPTALGIDSLFFQVLGRSGASLNEYIVDRDPTNANALVYLSLAYYMAGCLDDCLGAAHTALVLSPGVELGHWSIANALLEKGELQSALAAVEQEPVELHRLLGQVSIYHALGAGEKSDELLLELIDKYGKKEPYFVAWPLAYRGEADLAFQYLGLAVEVRDHGLYGIVGNRNFINLHDDPRWLPFLEGMGRSPAQLAVIEFEVELPA